MTSRNINNDKNEPQMTLHSDAVQRELPIDEQCLKALRNRDLRLTRTDRKVLCRVVRQKGSEEFFLGGLLGIQLALFVFFCSVSARFGRSTRFAGPPRTRGTRPVRSRVPLRHADPPVGTSFLEADPHLACQPLRDCPGPRRTRVVRDLRTNSAGDRLTASLQNTLDPTEQTAWRTTRTQRR